jgi:hypothetical protein
MIIDEKLDSDYLAMSELTKEIGLIVNDSVDEGRTDLSSSDIEHILKITSDVTHKMKSTIARNYNMNSCNGRHEPVFKIKYKPLTFGGNASEWLVCEKCFGRQEFFGAAEEIESIVSLRDCIKIGLEIKHLSVITGTVTKKLKNHLHVN